MGWHQHRPVVGSGILILSVVGTTTGPASAQTTCPPLPPPTGVTIEVTPDQASSLAAVVASAASGTTILLHDGTYDLGCGDLGCRLQFWTPGVALRSLSGNRESVVLDGEYGTSELISIHASDITIAGITLERAYDHPIHISTSSVISGILLHDLHIRDPGQQAVKVNNGGVGAINDGTLECCHIELTDTGRAEIRDGCYTGGIDMHDAGGWLIRRNLIEGFWCDTGLSEHGIHLWQGASDTTVEENLVRDCARGIGFGLGADPAGGHTGGVIRNNFVAASDPDLFSSPYGFDTGIALESAAGAAIYHNTVVSTQAPASSSIEWRWPTTTATVANNLTSHWLLPRDGGSATLQTNTEWAPLGWFEDPSAGDLHLTAAAASQVDAGTPLAHGLCDSDFDGLARDGSPDIGADELGRPIFSDNFESGDARYWTSTVPSRPHDP
jgi:hypothetical protein